MTFHFSLFRISAKKEPSIDAIRAIAGPDYEKAVIPEERRQYLSRYDATSAHYDVGFVQHPGELPAIIG